jgi:hypoxanthine phosphoribosyltransferase
MLILPLFEAEQVEARLDALAHQLYRDYADSPFSMLCITAGARRFADSLRERLGRRGVRCDVQHVGARRLPDDDGSGTLQIDDFDAAALEDRDVLVVADVADRGLTLRAVLDLVALGEARSVRTAVLVDKTEHRSETIRLDYAGFEVERGWVVGFGMEVDGEFGDLDEIARVSES